MFDFSRSSVGVAPREDIYASSGPESHWGISPGMRASMDKRATDDLARQFAYAQRAGAGASPVSLALMDPELYYRRTGQSMSMVGDEPVFFQPGSARGVEILSAVARRQAADSALKSALMLEEISSRYDPLKSALRTMPQEEAAKAVRVQTGVQEAFGGGGQPSKLEAAQKIAETHAKPGLIAAETGRELAPSKIAESQAEIDAIRAKIAAMPTEQRLHFAESLGKIIQTLGAYGQVDPALMKTFMSLFPGGEAALSQRGGYRQGFATGQQGAGLGYSPEQTIATLNQLHSGDPVGTMRRDPATGVVFVKTSKGWVPKSQFPASSGERSGRGA